MPTLVCPVCGTENPSTRLFCRKCASDLHATAVVPGLAPTPPPDPVPVRPALIGAGVAALVILLIVGAVIVLGGSPAASPAPSASPSPAPSAPAGPTLTPTGLLGATPTAAAPTGAPAATSTPATPGPTPTDAPPIIRYFRGPTSVNCSDPSFAGTIHLSWRIGNADGVNLAIDGPGFYKTYTGVLGEDDVPFACGGESHTYFLTTFGGLDPVAEADLIIGPAATP